METQEKWRGRLAQILFWIGMVVFFTDLMKNIFVLAAYLGIALVGIYFIFFYQKAQEESR